ncbi:4Fe-4S binding protein [Calderihabitans maritimus]|nr:4Fe-4S binding protein [Calderihabitans maritimus]
MKKMFTIETCRAAASCTNACGDIKNLASTLEEILEAQKLGEILSRKIKGPVLSHHIFKVSLSGCPNSCSQPQIKDFGVQARAYPLVTREECSQCGTCEAVCQERAVRVGDRPEIKEELCLACGACARVCPTGTLSIGERAYTVLIGGKLGRHPQLAKVLLEKADAPAVERALKTTVELFVELAHGQEKLGALLNRIGLETVQRRLQAREGDGYGNNSGISA